MRNRILQQHAKPFRSVEQRINVSIRLLYVCAIIERAALPRKPYDFTKAKSQWKENTSSYRLIIMIDHCHFLQSIIIHLRSLFRAAKITQTHTQHLKESNAYALAANQNKQKKTTTTASAKVAAAENTNANFKMNAFIAFQHTEEFICVNIFCVSMQWLHLLEDWNHNNETILIHVLQN